MLLYPIYWWQDLKPQWLSRVGKLARPTVIWICEFENRETAMLSSHTHTNNMIAQKKEDFASGALKLAQSMVIDICSHLVESVFNLEFDLSNIMSEEARESPACPWHSPYPCSTLSLNAPGLTPVAAYLYFLLLIICSFSMLLYFVILCCFQFCVEILTAWAGAYPRCTVQSLNARGLVGLH